MDEQRKIYWLEHSLNVLKKGEVLLFLYFVILCKPRWKNVKPYHRNSNQGPSAYRADALSAVLRCSSHSQWHKHDISLTCLHLLAIHITQVGLRPQTIPVHYLFVVLCALLSCYLGSCQWRETSWLGSTAGAIVITGEGVDLPLSVANLHIFNCTRVV